MYRVEKVKDHFKNNARMYVVGGICLVAGVGGGFLIAYKKPNVSNKQIQILTWKSKQVLEVFVEALGDPGNIIQDTTTGTIYASQGQAARELGLSGSELSKHLNGLTNHVKGHKFIKLGKAMFSESQEIPAL